jgi:hypothetical protein
MRIHWWQSIRWRLALGSVMLVLLVTVIMALSTILTIVHYYSNEQKQGLTTSAEENANDLGRSYAQNGNLSFQENATKRALATKGLIVDSHGENYLFLVFNQSNHLDYPSSKQLVALNPQNKALWDGLIRRLRLGASARPAVNPTIASMSEAIFQAQNGVSVPGEIGPRYLLGLISRPFMAVPIRSGGAQDGTVVGVLLMAPLSAANSTLPVFVNEVWQVVVQISVVVAVLAALAAILFARTITRPLTKVTAATRVLT